MNLQAVTEFRKSYARRAAAKPSLYINGPMTVTVGLPAELLEYANAAAGHSGYGSGARPCGIRKTVANPKQLLSQIFESDESLIAFLMTRETDFYTVFNVNGTRKNSKTPKTKKISQGEIVVAPFVPAKADYWNKYSGQELSFLRNKYGVDLVTRAMTMLSLTEMENLFGM